jgi:hypothetical protein
MGLLEHGQTEDLKDLVEAGRETQSFLDNGDKNVGCANDPDLQLGHISFSEDPKNALIRRDCMIKDFYLPSTLVKFGNRGTIPLGGALRGAVIVSRGLNTAFSYRG